MTRYSKLARSQNTSKDLSMSREIISKNSFAMDFIKAHEQGLISEDDILELGKIVDSIANSEPLDPKYRCHTISRDSAEFRNRYIKPDLMMVYKIDENSVFLARIGRHKDLFKGCQNA